jgi:hypothetical protein
VFPYFCPSPVYIYIYIVTCWVYVTRQVTSRRIAYSEIITLALTFQQFTITQVLPSAVSQTQLVGAGLHWTRRLLDWNSLRGMQHSNCLTAARTLSYKPLAGQWTTCLVSLLRCHLVYRLPTAVVTRLACCLTSCLPALLGNAARAAYSSLATSVLRLGSARLGSLRFISARQGETPREGGVYRVMRRPRHNILQLTFLRVQM